MKSIAAKNIILALSILVFVLIGAIVYLKNDRQKYNQIPSANITSTTSQVAVSAPSTLINSLPVAVQLECPSFVSKTFSNLSFCASKLWSVDDQIPVLTPNSIQILKKSVVVSDKNNNVLSFDFTNSVGLGPQISWITSNDFIQINSVWSRMKGAGEASSFIYVRNDQITKKGSANFTQTKALCDKPDENPMLNCTGAASADAFVTKPTHTWIKVVFEPDAAGVTYPALKSSFDAYKTSLSKLGVGTILTISFFGNNPLSADEIMKTVMVDLAK